jgi:hypothetical protein
MHQSGFSLLPYARSRYNATLHDGQVVGLPVDAFPYGGSYEVRKRGCAVSGNDSYIERLTDKLQIHMK